LSLEQVHVSFNSTEHVEVTARIPTPHHTST
jgi:hypothetical protein